MLEAINSVVTAINGVVWGWPMIILLFGTHLYMTFRTGFIQWKSVTKGIKLSVTKDPEAEGEVSQFGALTTALAATIGTGNIIGVGTAIALGGPGAVLWIWLTGVFGIATKYAESLIAVKYRVKTDVGAWIEYEVVRSSVCYFRRICFIRYRMCNAGERNCNSLLYKLPHSKMAGRCGSCNINSNCYFRWNQSDCKCM